MEYFILQQDSRIGNTIHLPIHSLLSYADYCNYILDSLPRMTVITREGSKFEQYPDIFSTLFLVSEKLNEVISIFTNKIDYKLFCFVDHQKDMPYYYYAYMLPGVPCLSDKSIISNGGTVVSKLVICRKTIGDQDIVRVDGIEYPLVLVSLPVAEAILRRNYKGIRLLEIYYDD